MIFVIRTNDEVSGIDITNLLNFAHIEHTILSKQSDESAQQQRAADKCQKCGGSGSIKEDYNLRTCPRCDGEGICR